MTRPLANASVRRSPEELVVLEMAVKGLVRIGIVRIETDGSIRWPLHVCPWPWWVACWRGGPFGKSFRWFGFFRNKTGIIKWQEGRLLPRRWGFHVLGLEIGDRG